MLRAVRGLVNELYLDDLREKVKRGMRGVFERGCCPGGKVYGYRTEECEAGKRFVIYEPEARIVREIFTRFAAGWSAGRIVDDLNRRRVLSPRGGKWMVSALVGVDSLGTGLLNNRLYAGMHIFGRFEWRKDPTTGKRTKRVRPESEWLRAEHPELRNCALWTKKHGRACATASAPQATARAALRQRPFSAASFGAASAARR